MAMAGDPNLVPFPMAMSGNARDDAASSAIPPPSLRLQRQPATPSSPPASRPASAPPLPARARTPRHDRSPAPAAWRRDSAAAFAALAPPDPPATGRAAKRLPLGVLLSPRADAWAYLAAASFVGLASVVRADVRQQAAVDSPPSGTGAALIGLLSANAAVSLGLAVAYRIRPALLGITRPLTHAAVHLSPELLLACLALILWALCMGFADAPLEGRRTDGAVATANLFYSLWVAGALTLYLLADLLVGNQPAGISLVSLTDQGGRGNDPTVTWLFLFFSSSVLLAYAAAVGTGLACEGPYLRASPYCASASLAVSLSATAMALCLARLACQLHPTGRRLATRLQQWAALAVLGLHTGSAAVVTGPGGAAANAGNVYVATWLCLGTSLALNVDYLGRSLTLDVAGESETDQRDRRRFSRTSSHNTEAISETDEEAVGEREEGGGGQRRRRRFTTELSIRSSGPSKKAQRTGMSQPRPGHSKRG